MPGSPEDAYQYIINLYNSQNRDQKQPHRDNPTDYSEMFAYIRADKSTPDFLADLRDNKTHLLSCCNEVFEDRYDPKSKEPSGLRTLETKYHVAMHLDHTLKLDVYDMDLFRDEETASPMRDVDEDDIPFTSMGAEELAYRGAVKLHSFSTASLAAEWLETHSDSEAAKDIALLGVHAPLDQRQRLLQEMWPTYVKILTGQSEKKS